MLIFGKSQQQYVGYLKVFIKSLKLCGYHGEIIILVTQSVGVLRKFKGVIIKQVPLLRKKRSAIRNVAVLTKLNIWNLLEYEQIIYYDADVIFLKDPSSAYNECPVSNYSLCAVSDDGTKALANTYFNSGFLVIQPNKGTYDHLISSLHIADKNDNFVDQDMLNIIFKDKWKRLDKVYNILHIKKEDEKQLNTFIAIHEKLEILQRLFPDKSFLWNKHLEDFSSSEFKHRNDSVILEGWKILAGLKD